jgi:SAM-dependent methyltransferase
MSASRGCAVCSGAMLPERRFGPTPLRRCVDCGFIALDGGADPGLYRDAYFAAYAGGGYLEQAGQRRREARRRLDLLGRVTAPPARLLEVGAAAGFFLDEARQRGYEGTGVEPNATMAAHGRDALGLDLRTATLAEAELAPGSFDAACAFHVIEHLTEPLESVRAVTTALRPGAHLLIEVPNVESASARRRGPDWPPLDLPHHVGHHNPRSIRELLRRAGLEVLRIDTVPFAFYGAGSRAALLVLGLAEAARAGALLPAGPHPHGHQLLRAVARRPPA